MLKKVSVSNYHSIGQQAVEMCFDSELPIYIVMGGNASGKTTLLKAISFIFWFMNSDEQHEKDEMVFFPHVLHKTSPSVFAIEYTDGKAKYQYQLEFKNGTLVREEFSKHVTRGYSRVYSVFRTKNNVEYKLSNALKSVLNENDKVRYGKLKNCSFYRFLQNTGYFDLLNIDVNFVKNIVSNSSNIGRQIQQDGVNMFFSLANILQENKKLQDFLINHLQMFDFNISKFVFDDKQALRNDKGELETVTTTSLVHKTESSKATLPLLFESEGTYAVIPFLINLYELIKNGGVMIWDELENSTHPLVAKKFISVLKQYVQHHNIQIIFASHMNALLNEFEKKSIFFVEKTDLLETDVYTLNDVEGVRKDENFADKYIGGVYGGTPDIMGVA